MDIKEKAKLKENIKKKLKTINEDIAAYEQLTKPVSPDNAIGRLTRMEAISSKSINEAALGKAKDTRSQLERALAKIDAPDFGLCRQCDEPIPSARLMILPETDLCVQCAERMSD
ncbi:prokaryotic dksA/traR C4-type zinc finger family protein [Olavius algarvensis Delta 1 endosymbiont]|nr:prokaryotic dksA/traR C4-type zinc finger family protein [Olavius algarvensis Delta 1 endosymbiont]